MPGASPSAPARWGSWPAPAATAARMRTGSRSPSTLLRDPVFDAFLTGTSPFAELPDVVQRPADGTLDALCHVIEYPADVNNSISHRNGKTR